jgi:hypothetical protein
MESPLLFRGTLVQYAGGQSLAGPYRAPSGPFNAGTKAVQFSASGLATVGAPLPDMLRFLGFRAAITSPKKTGLE